MAAVDPCVSRDHVAFDPLPQHFDDQLLSPSILAGHRATVRPAVQPPIQVQVVARRKRTLESVCPSASPRGSPGGLEASATRHKSASILPSVSFLERRDGDRRRTVDHVMRRPSVTDDGRQTHLLLANTAGGLAHAVPAGMTRPVGPRSSPPYARSIAAQLGSSGCHPLRRLNLSVNNSFTGLDRLQSIEDDVDDAFRCVVLNRSRRRGWRRGARRLRALAIRARTDRCALARWVGGSAPGAVDR